ncbi:MAG: hypothetical protein ACR2P7_03395, partial [bacterium]
MNENGRLAEGRLGVIRRRALFRCLVVPAFLPRARRNAFVEYSTAAGARAQSRRDHRARAKWEARPSHPGEIGARSSRAASPPRRGEMRQRGAVVEGAAGLLCA